MPPQSLFKEDCMMYKLKTVEKLVYDILKQYPAARDNDMELYYLVGMECFFLSHGGTMLLFEDVMRNYRLLGIPCFESVRRTRQKIQAKHPELGCSPETRRARTRSEAMYREYASSSEVV